MVGCGGKVASTSDQNDTQQPVADSKENPVTPQSPSKEEKEATGESNKTNDPAVTQEKPAVKDSAAQAIQLPSKL